MSVPSWRSANRVPTRRHHVDGHRPIREAEVPECQKRDVRPVGLGDLIIMPSEDRLKKALSAQGLNYLGLETAPIGATDFSALLARLKRQNLVILHVAISGLDT